MADITNAESIRFVNEQLRPMAERLRNLYAVAIELSGVWHSSISAIIGDSADDDIIDNREAEGVSRLTAEDISNLIAKVDVILTQFGQPGVLDTIRKPCVRGLEVVE